MDTRLIAEFTHWNISECSWAEGKAAIIGLTGDGRKISLAAFHTKFGKCVFFLDTM